MAQRTPPRGSGGRSGSGSSAVGPGTGGSRRRGKPVQVQVQPSRPWGLIAGSVVLALALVGLLGFAISNQGSGFSDPLETADGRFEGQLVRAEGTLERDHVPGPVAYPQVPPSGGDHSATWQDCTVYEQPVPTEQAVHSLEHGAVWISHRTDLPAAQVTELRELADGRAYVLLSPVPEQAEPIVLTAWGRRLPLQSLDAGTVREFVSAYADGPQTPEKGATCAAGTGSNATGTTAAAPAAPAAGASPATG